VYASRDLVSRHWLKLLVVALAGTIVFAQALTGGRMGYVTWAVVGLILCSIRGRWLLVAGPVLAVALLAVVPAAADRLLQGFDPSTSEYGADPYSDGPDLATITAGRTIIWPYVRAKIAEAPMFGYGRLAMQRTGLSEFLATSLDEGFAHPHNAYLELLLDNGIIGFLAVIPFYVFVVLCALRLYADSRSPVFVAAGGIAAAMTLSLLVAAMGSQTFYPREGAVGMWCAIGLLLRVRVERARAVRAVRPTAKHTVTGLAAPAGAHGLVADVGDIDGRLWVRA
jgi:O-antigen ligase